MTIAQNGPQSAVAYRVLGPRRTVQELAQVNTAPLPDGAQCWVTQSNCIYTLDRRSTLPADNDLVVAPGSGPGRWIRSAAPISGVVAAAPGYPNFGDGPQLLTLGAANVWVTPDVQLFGGGLCTCDLDNTTGVVTLSDPWSGIYQVTINLMLGSDEPTNYDVGVTIAARPDTSGPFQPEVFFANGVTAPSAPSYVAVGFQFLVGLAQNAQLRLALCNLNGPANPGLRLGAYALTMLRVV